jgi:hypothetical protein
MHKAKICLGASAGLLAILFACQDLVGPRPTLRVPDAIAKSVGPPDPHTYTFISTAHSGAELVLDNFHYPQWIVVKPNGPRFMLYAYSPALPQTQSVGATGAAGGRNGCDMNSTLSFGMVSYGFGPCGQGAKWDTVLAQGQGFIRLGSMPLDFTSVDNSDCPPRTSGGCHYLDQPPPDISFTVWAYPAMMVPVSASPRIVNFASVSYQPVTFTTGANPATVVIGGVTHADTMTTTSWVYTAGDGTQDGDLSVVCKGGYPRLTCSPNLHKSGRLVVKALLGGWEQTSSVSVQCLVSPADSVLNDTTGDFAVRDSVRSMYYRANADSATNSGFDVTHPGWTGGWAHETGIDVWKTLSGQTVVDTITPIFSDMCNLTHSPTPPDPNDALLADMHAHEVATNDTLFCRRTVYRRNGKPTQIARTPQEAAQGRPIAFAAPDTGADRGDRTAANRLQKPEYVLTRDGRVLKIDPVASDSLPNPQTWWRAFGGTSTQQKCAWPRPGT